MGIVLSAILAGLLTSFSPCVISALPFVISSSLGEDKKGPLFLVSGLITSFVILGVAFALSTKIFGLEQDNLKFIAAIVFILLGIIFLFPSSADYLSARIASVANLANNFASRLDTKHSIGQFLMGLLLGIIWSPCSGPTLGYALTLVAKEGNIPMGAFIMLIYGVSASLPLLFVAYISKNFIKRNMMRVNATYQAVKKTMGLFLLVLGSLTLTGLDKAVEAAITNSLPDFLLNIITMF